MSYLDLHELTFITSLTTVSLLPIRAKILERLMFMEIFCFFLGNNLISSNESVFSLEIPVSGSSSLCEKCPNAEEIFLYRIWTLFTQCLSVTRDILMF